MGDQLSALILEASIKPADFIDIEANDRLSRMWRGMPRNMYSLMHHVVGVTTTLTQLKRTVTHYDRAATHDGQSARRIIPSSHDCSQPRTAANLHEPPLASTSCHHGDEARPSTTCTNIDVVLPPTDP